MPEPVIKLKINGMAVEARPGMTVLECARSHGLFIPSLCDLEGLPAFAGCRLCLVEIARRPHRSPACQTLVEEGMEIVTSSPALEELRLATFELILSEHPYFCLMCQEKAGCDELKTTMVKALEPGGCLFCPRDGDCELQRVAEYLKLKRVAYEFEDRGQSLWQSDPFLTHNPNLCILCGRCVRVCSEVRGENVLSFIGRGPQTAIGTFLERNLRESDCSFCGACLDVCPVAAFSERGVTAVRGRRIYEHSFICPLCGSLCELEAEYLEDARLRRIIPESSGGPVHGLACARGRFGLREIDDLVRGELFPVLQEDRRLLSVTWEEALAAAGSLLKKYRPEGIALVSSGSVTADSLLAFYQLGHLLRTDNLYYFYPEAFLDRIAAFENQHGIEVRRKVDFKELERYRTFVLVDTDLKSEALAFWLEVKKELRRGARLLVLDSGLNGCGQTAGVNLRCLPGKEAEALLALLKRVVLKSPQLSFYAGYHRLLDELNSWPEERLTRESGLGQAELDRAAEILLGSSPALFIFGERFLRQPRWAENLAALWNLQLRLESGLLPVTGKANELLIPGFKNLFGLKTLTSTEKIEEAIRAGQIKALYVLGDLPLEDKPELLIVQKPLRSGLAEKADIFFTSGSCLESGGFLVDLAGRIKCGPRELRIPGTETRPADIDIISRLAETLGQSLEIEGYRGILESMLGEEPARNRGGSLSYLPMLAVFREPGKSTEFEIGTTGRPEELEVIVGDSLDHYGGLAMANLSPGFKAIRNPDWLWLNPRDGDRLGFMEGQKVVLETADGGLALEVKYSSGLRPGTAFICPVLDDSKKIKLFGQGIIKGTVRIKNE
ncbi:MAG: 2Fe-2S iron-sulfur cluster-binding protein [Candidatus Saccharicenans sp.]|jgi:predicted molibdopterin-dependent oxidoreductase YjgC|nr:2Fe-2S iron-sulfur cluster-binding protein [Candidatus Saccharicenans sp.]MDH7574420.1 2Fe-2S iron-sulfur cluster-binding protein [Candidatus Saccharicenans sp.]